MKGSSNATTTQKLKLLPFESVFASFKKNDLSLNDLNYKISSDVTSTNISFTKKLDLTRFIPVELTSTSTPRSSSALTQEMSSTSFQTVLINRQKLNFFSTTQIDLASHYSSNIAPTRSSELPFLEDLVQIKYFVG